MNNLSIKKNNSGFTLFEVLIAITISVAMLGVILSIYSLTMKSIGFSQDRSELSQNSRIIAERLTRDIRQARDIATVLPEDKDDPEITPPNELELRDGHMTETFQYIKYYLSSTNLHRQVRQYYFAAEPSTLVPFDAADDFGNAPLVNIIEDELVGQYINNIIFYGTNLLTMELDLAKRQNTHSTKNTLFGRNL
jgi:type II secretory pathway pseudopilin PulG